MKAIRSRTRRLALIGAIMLALVVAAGVSLRFFTGSASTNKFDSAVAHGWAGAKCAEPSLLSQAVDSSLAGTGSISVQAAVFSPHCGFYQHTVGLRNVASKAPADSNTRYGVASISKTLTASAVWTLIQRHRLRFNETIDHWFSPSELFGVHQTTVGDLLTGNTRYQSYDNTPQWKYPLTQHLSEQQVLRFIDRYGPVPRSGKLLDPLNGDYFILAVLLERVMHKPYSQVMSDLIFKPLGMQDTDVKEGLTPADGQHATPYSGATPADFNGSEALGSAAVESTATDLARFAYWNFVRPKTLNHATLSTIFGHGPLTQAYLNRDAFGLFDSRRFTNPSVTAVTSAIANWGPGISVLRYDRLVVGFYGNAPGNSAALGGIRRPTRSSPSPRTPAAPFPRTSNSWGRCSRRSPSDQTIRTVTTAAQSSTSRATASL